MDKNPFSEFDLSGKVAIVSGARRGMGHRITLALARYGSDLVICSRTTSELEKTKEEIERLGQVGQPEDVVGAVIYLASEASNMITGHVLLIDGGWTAH